MATTYTVLSRDEIYECGHHHKSIEAATLCGSKLFDSHNVDDFGRRTKYAGSWTANAKWIGWYIRDNTTDREVPKAVS